MTRRAKAVVSATFAWLAWFSVAMAQITPAYVATILHPGPPVLAGGVGGGGGGGGSFDVLNPATAGTGMVVSTTAVSNDTGSGTATGWHAVRGLTSHSTGKWCFAFIKSGTESTSVGIMQATSSSDQMVGGESTSYGWNSDGTIYTSFSSQANKDDYPKTAGDIQAECFDFDAQRWWTYTPWLGGRWNQDGFNNPSTGASDLGVVIAHSTYYIGVSGGGGGMGGSNTVQIVAVPTGVLPAGFSQW